VLGVPSGVVLDANVGIFGTGRRPVGQGCQRCCGSSVRI
jgi:hypothetical protein